MLTTTTGPAAYLKATIARILVLAATANCAAENDEDAYRALDRIYGEAYAAMMEFDEAIDGAGQEDDPEEAPF